MIPFCGPKTRTLGFSGTVAFRIKWFKIVLDQSNNGMHLLFWMDPLKTSGAGISNCVRVRRTNANVYHSPGPASEQCSFRSEAAGLYAGCLRMDC
jgi:hypothetical protein